MIGLQPIRQNAIQKMTGQVRGWPPPKNAVPTSPKRAYVEIAQARNLDISTLRSGSAGPILTRGMTFRVTALTGEPPFYRCLRQQSGRPDCHPPSSS